MDANSILLEVQNERRKLLNKQKYPALRIIAAINVATGILIVIIGALGLAISLTGGGASMFLGVLGFMWSAVFFTAGLAWVAGSELIYVLIDIEANTRRLR